MNKRICSCCRSLTDAIERYLAKADEDLAGALADMGYVDAEGSVGKAGALEEAVAGELRGQSERIADFLKGCSSLKAAKRMLDVFFGEDASRGALQEIFGEYYRENIPKLANFYIRETDGEMAVEQIRQRTAAWMEDWSEELSDLMQLSSEQQMGKLVQEALEKGDSMDGLARRIMDDGIRNEQWQARRAALTEMLRAHSVAQQEAMTQDPSVRRKKWRHTGSYRNGPRKNHVDMDGQVVLVDEPYELKGIKGGTYYPMYPRDTSLPPEESINCHCLSQPVVDDDVLGMSLEERQELQRQIIEEDDGKWMEELDAQNKAKAGIDENTVKLDWLKAKDREEQIKYFGGGEEGKQRLALVESGVITTDKELERLYKVDENGKRVRKTLQELADDGIFTVSSDAMKHSTVGDFSGLNNPKKPAGGKNGGNMKKGGHSQANIDELNKRGITYRIEKTYSNGVRIGGVENHNEADKRLEESGQSCFPEDWDEDKIRVAGTYTANNPEITIEKKNDSGDVTGHLHFSTYEGVTVGIFMDANRNPQTIFPDSIQRTVEGE